jgi:hypothetical protein
MHTDRKITEADLLMLYDWACELSDSSQYGNFDLRYVNKIGEKDGFELIAPEAEFFGCLTCNVSGWGAFCWASKALKRAC